MSLKSIDLQVIVQRTHDVGKMQQIQQQQANNQNHHNATQLRQQFNIRENSVNKLDYIDKNNIRDDGRGNKKNQQGKQNNIKNDSKNEDKEIDNLQKHLGKNLDLHI